MTAPARRWVRPVLLLGLAAICTWILIGVVGRVDWAAVLDSIGRLAWWQLPILLVVLAVRQILNASPLAFFIEGLGIRRAVQNDAGAIMMSTMVPPPADIVLRLAMFRSWGIPASQGLAGAMMNTVTFYVIRFSAPALGLVLVLGSTVPYHSVYAGAAVAGAAVAVSILLLLWAVLRRESAAILVGRTAGRISARVKKSIDPDAWAGSAVDFRSHVVRRSRRGIPASLTALTAMVVVDGLLLGLCVRFVDVSHDDLSMTVIVGAFLIAYPLTLFPLAGLGVLDAAVVAALVDVGGVALEPQLLAALIVYRLVTLAAPLLFGAMSVAAWRRATARATR